MTEIILIIAICMLILGVIGAILSSYLKFKYEDNIDSRFNMSKITNITLPICMIIGFFLLLPLYLREQ